ncbi:MAG: MFS transporter [Dehalococcoidia bacterium]|nr:MFS transporter [Dehalococcoidia bacterium]
MRLTSTLVRASSPLGVFRYRNFSFVWSSTALVGIGTQMESAVLGWFVLSLTDSPFLVGSIAAARMALNFLALFTGAIADRLPRNLLLISVEFVMGIMGILMLALILTDTLEVWHIFAITLFMGVVRLFQMPVAQSLVADTLPRERVNNGAAFNTVAMNIAMLGGPVIGGLLYKAFGPQGAYLAIASLYLASGMVAVGIRIDRSETPRPTEPVLRTVVDGLKYAAGNQVIWAVLTAAVVINLAGWTVHTSLAPIFARDVLGTDSAGLGLLLFAFGVGALSGSLGLAMVPNLRRVGRLLVVAIVSWHTMVLVFSLSRSLYLSMGLFALVGVAFASTQVLILTLLLRTTQQEFRGRIMGLRSFSILAYSFGSIAAGAIAGVWGAPAAAQVVGLVGITLILVLAVAAPKLRGA